MNEHEEKARELVVRFADCSYDWSTAKRCALRCVEVNISYENEMINNLEIDPHDPGWLSLINWEKVKEAIEKM